jgi:hypothetical protein
MKERLHEQISNDLQQISRNDTTVLTVALIVTVIFFGLAFGFAANTVGYNYNFGGSTRTLTVSTFSSIVMFVSLFVIVAINLFSITTIKKNQAQKIKLAESLEKLYKEENLGSYFEGLSVNTFETRRNIYTAILGVILGAAVIIPLATFIVNVSQI